MGISEFDALRDLLVNGLQAMADEVKHLTASVAEQTTKVAVLTTVVDGIPAIKEIDAKIEKEINTKIKMHIADCPKSKRDSFPPRDGYEKMSKIEYIAKTPINKERMGYVGVIVAFIFNEISQRLGWF